MFILIYDLTPLKWMNSKSKFDLWRHRSLRITKTLQKQKIMFMVKKSLLTAKFETVFLKFRSGYTSLRDKRSSDLSQDAVREFVEGDSHKSTHKLMFYLATLQSIICRHSEKIGKVSKLVIWVPHTQNEKLKEHRISIRTRLLLLRQRNYLFL